MALLKIPYKNFSEKLQYLWNTSGDIFPPTILTNDVYFNGKIIGQMDPNQSDKNEIGIETCDQMCICTLTNKEYMVTYGTWMASDQFSYIIIPLGPHLKKKYLVDKLIPRINPKETLRRLGIIGLDYCLSDMTDKCDNSDAFYIYKNRKHAGALTEPGDKIGYIISIHDDYIECIVDKRYIFKTKIMYPYAKFIVVGEEMQDHRFAVKSIRGVRIVRKDRLFRARWAARVFENFIGDYRGNEEFRG